MKQTWFRIALFPSILLLSLWLLVNIDPSTVYAQEGSSTPTPGGIYVTVLGDEPFANVRVGPSSSIYPVIGQLSPGDTAPALGRSPGGDWIQIEFPGAPNNKGWVYSPLVVVSPGTLQIMEPPPTPIPPPTSTIDPTLAAQFTILPTNTRLPTFTPAPTLSMPIFTQEAPRDNGNSVPLAVVIFALGGFGIFGLLLSFVIYRR